MITNASPLIIFGKVNQLDLLTKIFEKIVISRAVYQEVVEKGSTVNAPDALLVGEYVKSGLIEIKELKEEWRDKASLFQKIYTQLDLGEAETIALALQEKEKSVLIDERIARRIAKLYNLEPIGSLKVLLMAYMSNIISEEKLRIILSEITSTKFRLSAEIMNKFWMLFEKLKNKS